MLLLYLVKNKSNVIYRNVWLFFFHFLNLLLFFVIWIDCKLLLVFIICLNLSRKTLWFYVWIDYVCRCVRIVIVFLPLLSYSFFLCHRSGSDPSVVLFVLFLHKEWNTVWSFSAHRNMRKTIFCPAETTTDRIQLLFHTLPTAFFHLYRNLSKW